MLHVVLATFCVRLACYYLLPLWGSPWAVLPVELLHGITFACGWGAGTINCKRVAPPGLEATMQVGPSLRALGPVGRCTRRVRCRCCCTGPGWAADAAADAVRRAQGIFQGLYFGVGQGLGGVIGGALKEWYGSQNLFGLSALIVLAGWASVIVAERACKLRGGRQQRGGGGATQGYQRVEEG
jgi:hypothetical protein